MIDANTPFLAGEGPLIGSCGAETAVYFLLGRPSARGSTKGQLPHGRSSKNIPSHGPRVKGPSYS